MFFIVGTLYTIAHYSIAFFKKFTYCIQGRRTARLYVVGDQEHESNAGTVFSSVGQKLSLAKVKASLAKLAYVYF